MSRSSSPVLSPDSSDSEAETRSVYTPSDDENNVLPRGPKEHHEDYSPAHPQQYLPDITEVESGGTAVGTQTNTHRCAHITKAKKRAYNFVNRVPAIQKKVIRKEKWISQLRSMTVSKLRSTTCCTKLKCFRHVDYDQFMERAQFILSASTEMRHNILKSYRMSDWTFQFDGRRVCVQFLKKSFRFSTELVSAVRKGTNPRHRTVQSQTTAGGSTTMSKLSTNAVKYQTSESTSVSTILKKKEAVASFLMRLAEDCGDAMLNRLEVHLPFHQHNELYPVFCREFKKLYPH